MCTEKKELKVISASRRTDLVGCYPDVLMETLSLYPPDMVHTVVIWTKNPTNMITMKRLRGFLKRYHLYIHLTITGMGNTLFEPGIPSPSEVLSQIPKLIELVGDPQRICWRFDPIVHVIKETQHYTNLDFFPQIAEQIRGYGITVCRSSYVYPYKKVIKRLHKNNIILLNFCQEEMHTQWKSLQKIACIYNISLFPCCVEGLCKSSCIDGNLLAELHPQKLVCSTERAKGQRELCGCTESLDIGWYDMKCFHGCLYCYANPA